MRLKHYGLLATLIFCVSCINKESPAVDEQEEASWWCSFYGSCKKEENAMESFYRTASKKDESGFYGTSQAPTVSSGSIYGTTGSNTAGSTSDNAHVDHD